MLEKRKGSVQIWQQSAPYLGEEDDDLVGSERKREEPGECHRSFRLEKKVRKKAGVR